MSLITPHFGSQIASVVPVASRERIETAQTITTLQDVLLALEANPPSGYAMLRTTAGKLAEFYGKPTNAITIEAIDADRYEFRDFLRQHKSPPNSVRSYSNYANTLVKFSRKWGWKPSSVTTPAEWQPLIPAIKQAALNRIVRFLVRQGRVPATVGEADLASWIEGEVRNGRSYTTAKSHTRSIRRMLIKAGIGAHLSQKRVAKKRYGIPLENFPEKLRYEVEDAIQFRLSRFVRSRSKSAQLRPVTAKALQQTISGLYGYAVNIMRRHDIDSLAELVTEDTVSGFIQWALDEREVKGESLSCTLALVSSALGQNPKYSHITGSWFSELLNSIPEDLDDEARRRKEERYLPYDTLRAIPGSMRRERPTGRNATPRELAIAVRDELLMLWPLILPWRQLNIRMMRIGGDRPNLFKAPFPKITSMSKPEWVAEAERHDPGIAIWQIRFSKNETKTKHEVEAVLPRVLVPLLEEYLSQHRLHLVQKADPGTLFLNQLGNPLCANTVRDLLAQFTLKYGGRIVTPHLFRDIFAFMYLEKVPEDYVTLSKILWHRNIQTTLAIYGGRFNESAALCRRERLLGF